MKEFEEIMFELETVLRADKTEAEALRGKIRKVAETTGNLTCDIAEEILRMALAGRGIDDIFAVLDR